MRRGIMAGMKPKHQPKALEPSRNQGFMSSSTFQAAQIIFSLVTRRENGRYLTTWECNACGARGASGKNRETIDDSVAQAKDCLFEHQRIAHTGRRLKILLSAQ
jgi:hypothetical protein